MAFFTKIKRQNELMQKIREVCARKGMAHYEKDLGIKLDVHGRPEKSVDSDIISMLIREGTLYSPRPMYLKPTEEPQTLSKGMIVAFDVDGTLECGSPRGPIKLEVLKKMKKQGFVVGIISPSLFRVKRELGDLLDFYKAGPKEEAMRDIKLAYSERRALYVGDAELDKLASAEATWEFCYTANFSTI